MAGKGPGLFRALKRAAGMGSGSKGPGASGQDMSAIGLYHTSTKIGSMSFRTVKDVASFKGKVLLIVKPKQPLGQAEVQAIVQRVQNGLGVLLVGDGGEDNSNLNPLAIWFGVQFNNDIVSSFDKMGATTNTPYTYAREHAITEPLHIYEIDKSCSLRLRDWNRQALLFSSQESFSDADGNKAWDTGEYLGSCAVMAQAEYGRGRAIFIGDAIMFERRKPQDMQLLNLVAKWLGHEM